MVGSHRVVQPAAAPGGAAAPGQEELQALQVMRAGGQAAAWALICRHLSRPACCAHLPKLRSSHAGTHGGFAGSELYAEVPASCSFRRGRRCCCCCSRPTPGIVLFSAGSRQPPARRRGPPGLNPALHPSVPLCRPPFPPRVCCRRRQTASCSSPRLARQSTPSCGCPPPRAARRARQRRRACGPTWCCSTSSCRSSTWIQPTRW